MHVVLDWDPIVVEYLPSPHNMQSSTSSLPSLSRYVPAGQLSHVSSDTAPMLVEYLPIPHRVQSSSSSFPITEEYLPSPQASQVSELLAPEAFEYLPAPQAWHQALESAAGVPEYLPAPHSWHVASDTAPSATEYVPAKQSRHVSSDTAPFDTLHSASNPAPVTDPSVANITCKYPVPDVYRLFRLTELPESVTTSSDTEQSADKHRLIVTVS